MATASQRNDAIRIDLYSDTKTKPTAAMRKAMADAEVGDEQAHEDPTTRALEDRAAELLGKEAAVFLPSGTMCNEIALAVHCRPGEAVLADRTAHIIGFEGGGPGAIAGVVMHPLDGERGVFTVEQAESAIAPTGFRHAPRTRLIEVENTANVGGGTVWPVERVRALGDLARTRGLALHMDGARLLNATAGREVPPADYAAPCDSVWFDLSKGLGCPVGAVLAGSRDFIEEAWIWKTRLGGALRQSGILAAAGLHALDHHVERLAEDNANAKRFAELTAEIPGIALDPDDVHSNIVFFDTAGVPWRAPEIARRLEAQGVRIGAFGACTMRAVTHLHVDRAGVEEAAEALRQVVAEAD